MREERRKGDVERNGPANERREKKGGDGEE